MTSLAHCNHLVIVCCHAIYLGGPTHGASEDEWLIEPFQDGETPTFIQHVKSGVAKLAEDPLAILVFSGGPTKKQKTNLREGESYLNLAKDNNLFSHSSSISPDRLIAETHATDSYQNVLFSLVRFKEHTGSYPKKVTVVTHEFKRKRFMECHFPAVGLIPLSKREGEERSGIGLWREDLYGVGTRLAGKRAKRGWHSGMEEELFVTVDLEPVVRELICWNGGETGNDWFPRMKELPWYSNA
ncbi:hypothetical protein MAP00_002551 [Monascus purpureus]|nr:hypothetical protein MAP00_002551 [Monascus purpureus]